MRLRLLALLSFAFTLFLSHAAFAAGSVTLSTREPVEDDGKWKIQLTIKMGSKPDLPHVPFEFAFTATSLYERSLTDKSPKTPVLNRIALANQQPTVLSMDVGFGDLSGKVFDVSKFDFIIRRDRGFEAGEYDLVIKRSSDNATIGSTQHITLKGDNPIVDRRAIVFSGDKKKDAKMMGGDKTDADADKDKKDNANGDATKTDAPAGEAKTDEPGGEGATPPPVAPKQGGCGCRAVGVGESGGAAGVIFALGAAIVATQRRRRRRA